MNRTTIYLASSFDVGSHMSGHADRFGVGRLLGNGRSVGRLAFDQACAKVWRAALFNGTRYEIERDEADAIMNAAIDQQES